MITSKFKLASSGERYYRFLFEKKPKNKAYWCEIKENDFTKVDNVVLEESLFFSTETGIARWFSQGDTLVEVIFNPNHFSFSKLPTDYFTESGHYCGKMIFVGDFIPLNSDRFFEFIKAHQLDFETHFIELENHLIKIRAFTTLEKLINYQCDIDRSLSIKDKQMRIMDYIKYVASSDYTNIENKKLWACDDLHSLISMLSKENWIYYE